MTRRAQCAAVGGVALLGLLSLLGCGGDDARSRVPEEKASEPEKRLDGDLQRCLQ
ncbi:MAG: hypothetical protein WKF29_07245 [Thermoleophilaceae bacterium]